MKIKLLSILWIVFLVPYIHFMFIQPFVLEGFSGALEVWDRWQALNVGVLAFISSVVFFHTTKYKEEKQRQRSFIAARASLPQALSELTEYCRNSAKVWHEAIVKAETNKYGDFSEKYPSLPSNVHNVIKECIAHSEFDVGNYLAKILVELQIHNSRLSGLESEFAVGSNHINVSLSVQSNLWFLGKLQARIDSLFSFARGLEAFNGSEPSNDAIVSALNIIAMPSAETETTIANFSKK